jgi:hypothetical protein
MPAVLTHDLPFVDRPIETDASEHQLSRAFLRGFAAGQSLSSHEFSSLLPTLLEEFVRAQGDSPEARRFVDQFTRFAQSRAARLAVNASYLSEGAGI